MQQKVENSRTYRHLKNLALCLLNDEKTICSWLHFMALGTRRKVDVWNLITAWNGSWSSLFSSSHPKVKKKKKILLLFPLQVVYLFRKGKLSFFFNSMLGE